MDDIVHPEVKVTVLISALKVSLFLMNIVSYKILRTQFIGSKACKGFKAWLLDVGDSLCIQDIKDLHSMFGELSYKVYSVTHTL
jgi:hypothetical protein